MYLIHTTRAWFLGCGGGLLLGPEDAGAGGGAPEPGGGGLTFDDLGLPPDPDPAAQAQPDEDDEIERSLIDDDEGESTPANETADQRVNRLAKKHSKVKRQLAKALPTLRRVKGKNLDELEYKAR